VTIGPSSSADRSSARRGSSEPRAPSVRVHWGVGLRCRGLFLRPRRRPFVIGMPPNRSPRSNVALQCICAHQIVHEGWCSFGVWSVLIRTLGRRRLANWGVPVESHCSSRPKGSSTSKRSTEAVHPNLRHWANQRLPQCSDRQLCCAALQSIMLMALHGLYQAGLVQWVSSMSYQAVLPPHLPVASL
jgi:hypothetical protein